MSTEFVGGRVCLDFANTVDWRTGSDREELLRDYQALVDWNVRAGVLSPTEAGRLAKAAGSDPGRATSVYAKAVALREAIYRSALALAHGESAPKEDLARIVRAYADAVENARLTVDGSAYEWAFDDNAGNLDRAWWPAALSAVELLMSLELSRVRECQGRGCGWLFLDESRSRTRRWCRAAGCGNRERVRRYYERRRR